MATQTPIDVPNHQPNGTGPTTGDLRVFETDDELPSTRPSALSRLLGRPDSVIKKQKVAGYDRAQALVDKAMDFLSILKKDGLTIAYDVVSVGTDALQLVPIPAVNLLGSSLLKIWDAVQLIEMNRVACVRLTERCANAIISIGEEVHDAGPDVIAELDKPLMRLHEAFKGVHDFLMVQKTRRFIQRYLKRDEAQSDIRHCDSTLTDALFSFNTKIQIRALKIQYDLLRHAKDVEQRDFRSTTDPPSSTDFEQIVDLAPNAETDQSTHHQDVFRDMLSHQNAKDREADREDLHERLRSAMAMHDDGVILEVLGIKVDEIPETIATLRRILHAGRGGSQKTETSQSQSGKYANLSKEDTNIKAEPVLDDFDREFMTTGFDALVRLSQGLAQNVPQWTITRDEVELEEEIGGGFFSTVYKGQCRGRTVAIKLLDAVHTTRKLFVKEAEICMRLRHPNVMRLLGASSATSNPPWLLIIPYYRRGSLIRHMKGLPEDSPIDFVKMMLEVANGMEYLHKNDVLHGDLKASNILFNDNLCCVVADFGQSELKSEYSRVTAQEQLRANGAKMWLAPEVLSGVNGSLTCEVDIYAFAILCVEILQRGALPWGPLVTPDIVHRLVCVDDARPTLPSEYSDFDHPVSSIIRRAWAWRPSDRPPFKEITRGLEASRHRRSSASGRPRYSFGPSTATLTSIPGDILCAFPPPFIELRSLPPDVLENLRSSIAQIPTSLWHLLPANVQPLTDGLEQRVQADEEKRLKKERGHREKAARKWEQELEDLWSSDRSGSK